MWKVRPTAHMHTALRGMSHLRVVMRESKRERARERARRGECVFLAGGGVGGVLAALRTGLCVCARVVFFISTDRSTSAQTRQNTHKHKIMLSCAPPPPQRRRRVTFDGKVRNLELWANSSCLQIRFPPQDCTANTLSTADRLRHHCKLGGDSASIPGTSAYRWSIRGTRRVVRRPTRAV
jgi:hypothetical protein